MNNIITIEGVKKTIFGSGAISQLGNECKKLGASKALLVIEQDTEGLSKQGKCFSCIRSSI